MNRKPGSKTIPLNESPDMDIGGKTRLDPKFIAELWKERLGPGFDPTREFFNLYLDSPFCLPPLCDYCIYKPVPLHDAADMALKKRYYREFLPRHIREFRSLFEMRAPDAVYFGGGTSSLMSAGEMTGIFRELQSCFDFRNLGEKHFELNPRSATDNKLRLLSSWKFSHLTFGVQSFDERVLEFNHRKTVSRRRLREIFQQLEQSGMKYNVDLMGFIYRDDLEQDLEILRTDLDGLLRDLRPKRITVFPNYLKFEGRSRSIDAERGMFEKIRRFRETIACALKESDYHDDNARILGKTSDAELAVNLLSNSKPRRKDVPSPYEHYNSSGPNRSSRRRDINLLGLGGCGRRTPYSYTSDGGYYFTHSDGARRSYATDSRILLQRLQASHPAQVRFCANTILI